MITNVATFSLSKPNAGWPVWQLSCRPDYLDGKPSGSVRFKVEAGLATYRNAESLELRRGEGHGPRPCVLKLAGSEVFALVCSACRR